MSFLRNTDKKSEQLKAATKIWAEARNNALKVTKGELKPLEDKKNKLALDINEMKKYNRFLLNSEFLKSELISKKVKAEEFKRAGDRLIEISKQSLATLEVEEKNVLSRYYALQRLSKTPQDIDYLNKFIKLYDKTKDLETSVLEYTNHLKTAMLKIRNQFPTASLKLSDQKDVKDLNKKNTQNSDYEFLRNLDEQFPKEVDKKREYKEATIKLQYIDSISDFINQIDNELIIDNLINLLTVKDQKHNQEYDEDISSEILKQLNNLQKGPLSKLNTYLESPAPADDKDPNATPIDILSRKRSTWPAKGAKVVEKIDTYLKELTSILIDTKLLEPEEPKPQHHPKR